MARLTGFKRWIALGVAAFLVLAAAAAVFYRDDILRTALDPHTPYQVYEAPPAPDYTHRDAWALMPTDPMAASDLPVDVFFVHPTTYNGGGNWNAPIGSRSANEVLTRTMLPNYAGPFVRVGRIFATRGSSPTATYSGRSGPSSNRTTTDGPSFWWASSRAAS